MTLPKITLLLVLAVWVAPTAAQCTTAPSDDAVQDCSAIYGGDGAPIDVQVFQPEAVVLRSKGSDDARTGFAGSGGSIRAVVGRPLFGSRLLMTTSGGSSSGADTGGDAGDIDLLLDGGRGVRLLEIDANGGVALGTGVDGEAGTVAVELSDIALNRVVIEARGEVGGVVTVVLTTGAAVEQLVIDAHGSGTPGVITLDLAAETRVGTVQLAPGAQTFRTTGEGNIEALQVGETVLTTVPE